MNYEQKYKEALNKAQKELQCCGDFDCDAARQIFRLFPELKESEDERISREINDFLVDFYNGAYERPNENTMDSWLSWLEKQGEQKYDNNTKPKFKVGDWVVYEVTGSTYQIKNCIENLSNHKYSYDLTNGGYICSNEVNHYHLWTINDAKDGDVLSQDNIPFIFKRWDNNCIAYCGITDSGLFEIVEDNFSWCNGINVTLATKEQHELLFTKMKEAGYEWDAEKKQLIKNM